MYKQCIFLAAVGCMLFALLQEVKDSPDALSVKVSQFEVYNEQIYDLLAEEAGAVLGHRPALRLKEDSQGRIFVRDLSEVPFVVLISLTQSGTSDNLTRVNRM